MMTDLEILNSLTDSETMALTIYGESRGEPVEGQIAVANVIMNRFKTNKKWKTIKEVCLAPNQFSCWDYLDPNRKLLLSMTDTEFTNNSTLKQCMWITKGVIDSNVRDNTQGAQNYLTNSLLKNNPPKWADNRKNEKVIGNQTFFLV